MNFIIPTFAPASTEIFILIIACVALMTDLFLGKRLQQAAYVIVQMALLVAFMKNAKHLLPAATEITFNGLYVNDVVGRLLKVFISLSAFFAFFYSRHYVDERQMPRGEYYVLGLFSVLGMMVLVSAHSLLTIYLGLELMSLSLYAMVALQRDAVQASEAAMKYFVMGAIASGMMLYGMSMLYGMTGHLDLAAIHQQIISHHQNSTLLLGFSMMFILVGIGFKLAAVPFHMWAPDVYSGAPTSVTLFLATAPKLAAFGMLIRLLLEGLAPLAIEWQQVMMVMSILSMGLGNLLAIAQQNIKRMLAYSAISHIGYMLLGFVAGNSAAYSTALFYVIVYALMSLAGFGMLVLLSRGKFEVTNIDDLRGLNSRNPWLAFLMMLVMFSMAGVPPTIGFFAKFFVLKALIDVNLIWLAALALGFAIVGAFYYIRVVKTMYFDEAVSNELIVCDRDMQFAISVNSLALLGLGIFPGFLFHLCQLAFA